ncbi:hypothetical protein T03_3250 [Trichinella britovi]|uniref:Uncharacterized protein n=2 Tax=Trichinella TaxID=6333 RepID=A0A0V1DE87_TRIBR|nr:hypothetical protein T05_3100 [Trichinella murrelli]KRY59807.1 hypothetical protein T03_3250 [Trichinella britovi]
MLSTTPQSNRCISNKSVKVLTFNQSWLGDDGLVSTARFLRAVISSVWLPPALLPFFPGSHSRGNIVAFTRQIKPQAEAPPVDKEGTLRDTDWLEADRTRKAEVRVRKIMEEDQEGRADLGARFRIPGVL